MTHIAATRHTHPAEPTVEAPGHHDHSTVQPPARRMSTGQRNLIVAGAAVVAIVAMIASADALTALGRAVGWSETMAWALPVSVDVLAVVAGLAWLSASAAQKMGRWLTLGSVTMSVVLNAVGHLVSTGHLKSNSFLVILVSAVPPVAAALALHLGATVKSDRSDATADASAVANQPAESRLTDHHATAPGRQIDPDWDQDAHPENRSSLVPSSSPSAVPQVGPRATAPVGDRAVEVATEMETGTGTEPNGDRPLTVPNDNGDHADEHGSHPSDQGEGTAEEDNITVPGTEVSTAIASGSIHEAAAQRGAGPSPAAVPNGDEGREHPDTGTGTATEGDRPHTVPNNNGDREHPDTETGTATEGDRPHTVPVRRKPKPKTKAQRSRPSGGKSKRPRRKQLSLEETAELVRPHIPALLKRDGNAVITRPQLREILRALNLAGGRNENLTQLLQLLRAEAGTTTTRSTAR
ncbi:DUF2637 domain-containing protein [Streptomyces sp. NPDC002790]|uniref:DUF2637 domain-containing protein n=1 Tax=Streptomyces sp. NPDC002790 TaxID=3154431 RepID=UPI00331B0FC1